MGLGLRVWPRCIGCELLDLRKDIDPASGFDHGEAPSRFLFDGGRPHAAPCGKIPLDFSQTFRQLADRANLVVALMVVKPNREVDQALQEPALGLFRGCPDFLEHLVAIVELAAIEQLNALPEQSPRWRPSASPMIDLQFSQREVFPAR